MLLLIILTSDDKMFIKEGNESFIINLKRLYRMVK